MMNFLRKFYGSGNTPPKLPDPEANFKVEGTRSTPAPPSLFRTGDVIGGKYEILKKIGEGGFGIVYLALRDQKELCALKTFRPELLADAAVRSSFRKEALLWVGLEQHPHIVGAQWVDEMSGRLFVQMEYVAPDDGGRVTLADHLASPARVPTSRVIEWGIQFCLGMEHAAGKGIKCHRDIKPGNILIGKLGALKISDFGLAVAAESVRRITSVHTPSAGDRPAIGGFNLSTFLSDGREVCGNPGYMAPEVVSDGKTGIHSDIYSFGLVLWQMAEWNPMPPFHAAYLGDMAAYVKDIRAQQLRARIRTSDDALRPIIEKCLCIDPLGRFGNFAELRTALAVALEHRTGAPYKPATVAALDLSSLNAKGVSLLNLGRIAEAIACFQEALKLSSGEDAVWCNLGSAYAELEQGDEALKCYDRALQINSRSPGGWQNKAKCLYYLGRVEESLVCYDRALELDPKYPGAWKAKAVALYNLGRSTESLGYFDKGLNLDPRDTGLWLAKGWALSHLGRHQEALSCYDRTIQLDPLEVGGWRGKGAASLSLNDYQQAMNCFDRCVQIDPDDEMSWNNRAVLFQKMGRYEESIACCEKITAINPANVSAWKIKGGSKDSLGRVVEAVACYRKAVELEPSDKDAWNNMAGCLMRNGRLDEAGKCCDELIALDPESCYSWANKGVILRAQKRSAEEIVCYERTLKLDPTITWV